jgi:hypothetical protein
MKEAKNVIVRLEGRAFMIEIEISEEEMISAMISSLSSLINKGFPLRITHTSKQPLSRSQSMSNRVLKNIPDLSDWADDVRKQLRVQGARLSLHG